MDSIYHNVRPRSKAEVEANKVKAARSAQLSRRASSAGSSGTMESKTETVAAPAEQQTKVTKRTNVKKSSAPAKKQQPKDIKKKSPTDFVNHTVKSILAFFTMLFTQIMDFLFKPAPVPGNYKNPNETQSWLADAWYWSILQPVVEGIENVPLDRHVLFVANHAMGSQDLPSAWSVTRRVSPTPLRTVADKFWWSIPAFHHIIEYHGGFPGTRDQCRAVLKQGNLMIYPEGVDGVAKSVKLPKYQLALKNRSGFASVAAAEKVAMIPVSIVGGEDYWDGWFDLPTGWILRILDGDDKRADFTFPVPKPWKIWPRKLYIKYGKPIETSQFNGEPTKEEVWELREQVRIQMEKQIAELRKKQARNEGTPFFNPSKLDLEVAKVRRQLAKQMEAAKHQQAKAEQTNKAIGGM
eukprot:Clim_evm10s212 gene=Clim_evmTU10s212